MAWDMDPKGGIFVTPLIEFEVAAFSEEGVVLLRVVGKVPDDDAGPVATQFILHPDVAARFAKDLARAAKKAGRLN